VKPQRCLTYQGGPEAGDCYRACIASILNMPARDVPNFVHLSKSEKFADTKLAREWLAQFGLTIFQTWCSGEWKLADLLHWFSAINPGTPFILSGACQGDHHAVVVMDGRIAHDPIGIGVEGPCSSDGNWWMDIIAVANNWRPS
jgi:hypothetical protein